jgi:serine/threonine protein kinase/WD40 repeat protein
VTREQREIVNRLAEALLEISAEQRPAALDVLCAGLDPASDVPGIRAEVERLLTDDDALPARLTQITKPVPNATTRPPGPIATEAVASRIPTIIGRYHIRSQLGQGGMGQVFLAEQRSPIRRLVAVKLIAAGLESFEIIKRFDAERQALSRMDHPGIARVLDAGLTDAGRPYFVMEYVDGKPVTDFASEQKLSLRDRLELFAQICDAVAHAHTKGIIHRDLKPSNVLAYLDEAGKASVKVIDFGIAKAVTAEPGTRLSQHTQLTQTGVTVGTYEYMSPEQAAMSSDIDTRTDVYSLGVMLYELLAGVRPFELKQNSPAATDELRRMVREDDPPRPSSRIRALKRSIVPESDPDQLIRTLRQELEWIPLMALRKERDRRYAGPAEMAIDVRNYLENRPLIAAPESRAYRVRKFVSRYRAGLLVAALTMLLLVAGIVGTTLGMLRAESARKLADENGRRATQSAYRSSIVAAEVALRNSDSIRLRQALATAPAELRGWEWNYFTNLGDTFTATLQRDPGERFGHSVALPDGRRAISGTSTLSGSTVLWDLSTGKVLRREVGGIFAVDRAGQSLAILRPGASLDLVDVDTGSPRWSVLRPAPDRSWTLLGVSFSPDGRSLVAWDGSNDAITFFDVANGNARRIATSVPLEYVLGYVLFDGEPAKVAFAPLGGVGFYTLDPATGVTMREPRIAFLFNGYPFNEVDKDLWSPTNRDAGAPAFFVEDFEAVEGCSVYLSGQRLFAIGRVDGSIDLVRDSNNTVRNRANERLVAGSERVRHLAATADESHLIVTLATGEVGVMSIDPAPQVNVPLHGVFSATVAPDETKIVGGAWGEVQCIDTLTGLPVWGRNLGPGVNQFFAWFPDGSRLLVVTQPYPNGQSDVFLLDGHTGEQLAAWCDSPVTIDPARAGQSLAWARNVAGIRFDPTGETLFVAHTDGSLSRINVTDLSVIETIQPNGWSSTTTLDGEFFADLKISPDRRMLAQVTTITAPRACALGPLTLRDARTGQLLRRIDRPGRGLARLLAGLLEARHQLLRSNANPHPAGRSEHGQRALRHAARLDRPRPLDQFHPRRPAHCRLHPGQPRRPPRQRHRPDHQLAVHDLRRQQRRPQPRRRAPHQRRRRAPPTRRDPQTRRAPRHVLQALAEGRPASDECRRRPPPDRPRLPHTQRCLR